MYQKTNAPNNIEIVPLIIKYKPRFKKMWVTSATPGVCCHVTPPWPTHVTVTVIKSPHARGGISQTWQAGGSESKQTRETRARLLFAWFCTAICDIWTHDCSIVCDEHARIQNNGQWNGYSINLSFRLWKKHMEHIMHQFQFEYCRINYRIYELRAIFCSKA